MKLPRVEIPAIQNWSCHGCSDCCRGQLIIRISAEDKARIENQGWTKADGIDPATMMVDETGYVRLSHQSDGACVFLDSSGRCRIHSKFGEAAKPLACRLYPLVIRQVGGKLVVGMQFSCPSAAANRGKPLAERAGELQLLAREALPKDLVDDAPPPVAAAPGGEWGDFRRFVKWIDASLSADNVPIALGLLRTLHWLHAVEKGRLDGITDEGADEILGVLSDSARGKVPGLPKDPPAPSRFGRMFFRTMVVEHARPITVDDMNMSGQYRWKMLRATLRFLPAGGRTPALRENLKSVKFAEVEKSFGPLSAESDAMLRRFFRVKIQSYQFCGRAFHDASLMEGFRSLALLYPIIIWLARWQAVSDGRKQVSDDDVMRAIAMADYHHGFSPWLRWRDKLLAQRDDIARLCGWYAG